MIKYLIRAIKNRFFFLKYLPLFISQYLEFKRSGGVIFRVHPVLSDFFQEAGTASGHYFHQDLLVASFIFDNKPVRHIDIGSRIDGFVAHVASFRHIEVMDVRSLRPTGHENISFIIGDLMNGLNLGGGEVADSISCLHAIEHFGLGRYGDAIDPVGHIRGFNNIIKLLKIGGVLYISIPIGSISAVHFNAHRIFHPRDILTWCADPSILKLERFDFVDDDGGLNRNVNCDLDRLEVHFGCGIYTFRRMR